MFFAIASPTFFVAGLDFSHYGIWTRKNEYGQTKKYGLIRKMELLHYFIRASCAD